MNKLRRIIFFIINVLIILTNFALAIYTLIEIDKEFTWFKAIISFLCMANIWFWIISISMLEKEETLEKEESSAFYSNLYILLKGRRSLYVYNEHVKDKYTITNNHLYENEKDLGEIIGYDVGRPIKTEIGELICKDIRCDICPLQWACKQQCQPDKTLYEMLELREDIPDKIHKKLYKELKRKVNK